MIEPSIESRESSGGTRASLLMRVCNRDSVAWKELVELYGPLIAHWCRRCELDNHATADCVQEVFLSVHRTVNTYRPQLTSGSFRAWLWTITRNKIRDHLRKTRWPARGGSTALGTLRQLSEPEGEPVDEEPSSVDEIKSLVARAMQQIRIEFEARTWEIFQRSVVDQVATSTVAEQFKISPAAVRQIRSRILRRLREQLGDV